MVDSTKDFQDTLHEVLGKRLSSNTKNERVLQQILSRTAEESGKDFQSILKSNLKPLSEDRTKKVLEPKEETTKVSDKISVKAQVKSGGDLEKVLNSEEKNVEELGEEESKKSTTSNLTTREQTLKFMYETALDEYYTLKDRLYKYQIYDNDISLDDRNYLKLLHYENYLRKCDVLFKSSTGSFIANEDEGISSKENKYAYEASKSERQLMKQHEDSFNEVDRVSNEIQTKADEIVELNEQAKNGDVPDYADRLDVLEKEYLALNVKMSLLRPDIIELHRQEDEKELQDETTTRVVGTMYEKRKDKLAMDANVVRLDNRVDAKKETLEDVTEKESNDLDSANTALANSYIDAAETSLQKGDTKSARELVDKAKNVVGIKVAENLADDRKTDFTDALKANISNGSDEDTRQNSDETEGIDGHLAAIAAGTLLLTPVQEECAKAVNSPEERAAKALTREAKENLEKSLGPKERSQERSR